MGDIQYFNLRVFQNLIGDVSTCSMYSLPFNNIYTKLPKRVVERQTEERPRRPLGLRLDARRPGRALWHGLRRQGGGRRRRRFRRVAARRRRRLRPVSPAGRARARARRAGSRHGRRRVDQGRRPRRPLLRRVRVRRRRWGRSGGAPARRRTRV